MSCPCQPFSSAGSRSGFADDRHLWPAAHWLVSQQRPLAIIGEQVSGPDGQAWLDIVCNDLGALGYTVAALVAPSASVGAPNLRHRIWWVADARGYRCAERRGEIPRQQQAYEPGPEPHRRRQDDRRLAHTDQQGNGGRCDDRSGPGAPAGTGRSQQRLARLRAPGRRLEHADRSGQPRLAGDQEALGTGAAGHGMGDTATARPPDPDPSQLSRQGWWSEGRGTEPPSGPLPPWSELEWLRCTDGKARPTQPGLQPLAARHTGDVAKIRAYGNAINPIVAAHVIRAWMSCDD